MDFWNIRNIRDQKCLKGKKCQRFCYHGHHQKIEQWRRQQALKKTLQKRPDLLKNKPLSDTDKQYLKDLNISEKEDL